MTRHLVNLLSGPFVFLLVYFLSIEGLERPGQVVLATFAWELVWWNFQPVPWAATALLPLLIFPSLGVLNVADTAALFGQTIFFWIMGLALFGFAMEKHGLAKRFAIRLLTVRLVGNSTYRLLFFYMLSAGLISMFVTDAGVVAMMLPIGLSLLSYIRTLAGPGGLRVGSNLGNFIAIGTLYAAIAGGMATIMGAPPNIVAASLLERLTGETISFFRWMKIGIPVFLTNLIVFYCILRLLFPPELKEIPGGQEFLREEARKLGKLNQGEKNVLLVFSVMVILFVAPSVSPFLLGPQHSLTQWFQRGLSIWAVPPIVMFLLFALPSDIRQGKWTLTWKDAVEQTPWNAIMLCNGAVAMTQALSQFGFVEFMKETLTGIGLTSLTLPFVTAFSVVSMTEIASGVAVAALMGNIFIPAAAQVGFNSVSLTILLAQVAIGKMFPWSGAPAAMTFASGETEIKNMFKAALVVDVGLVLITVGIHLLFGSLI
jgi:sodium-dependent dicarboxylate transporter 2/3/5